MHRSGGLWSLAVSAAVVEGPPAICVARDVAIVVIEDLECYERSPKTKCSGKAYLSVFEKGFDEGLGLGLVS